MMKVWITALMAVSMFTAAAQKTNEDYAPVQYRNGNCRSVFTQVQLSGDISEKKIAAYLQETLANLKDNRTGLQLNYAKQSPGGYHYSFTQLYMGVPVYQSEIKVNLDRRNVIRSVFDNSENTSAWNTNVTKADNNSVIALHPETGKPVLCTRIITENSDEVLMADGNVVFARDMKAYAAQDSTVSGKIFRPDPLTSAQVNYGAPYYDRGDTTSNQLNAQLQTVQFKASYDAGVFSLKNDYIHMLDFSGANTGVPTNNNGVFDFNRSQSGFEYVNAFYHLNQVQDHIHTLGFDCADSRIDVDAHGTDADQSFFSPGVQPQRLTLGDGCVDDAEDADVVIHEYGHFVSETASPGSNSGNQRNALDEGFGDYLAASYSASISSFRSEWVFNWDGHNECWNGRVLNTTENYPINSSSIYRNGQIWSAVLWCLHGTIGGPATDSLILQTHYMYAQSISMPDAAVLLMQADTMLTGGKYACDIYRCLFSKGLHPQNPFINCEVGIHDEQQLPVQFFNHGSSFTLLNQQQQTLQMQVHNVQGRLVTTATVAQANYNYSNSMLPAGLYIVTLQSNGVARSFKWSKY
jgi:Zn-dependent metalloprotease